MGGAFKRGKPELQDPGLPVVPALDAKPDCRSSQMSGWTLSRSDWDESILSRASSKASARSRPRTRPTTDGPEPPPSCQWEPVTPASTRTPKSRVSGKHRGSLWDESGEYQEFPTSRAVSARGRRTRPLYKPKQPDLAALVTHPGELIQQTRALRRSFNLGVFSPEW